MNKLNFYQSIRNRALSFALIGTMLGTMTLTSCTKKEEQVETEEIQTEDIYTSEKEMVNSTIQNIKELFPELSEETIENSTLIILLNELAKENENGQINADVISNFKSKIDSDNMMNEFNSLLATLENTITEEEKIIAMSEVLPSELNDDATILKNIENIVENIMNGTEKKQILSDFEKIYTLFVEEDEIEIDGIKFEIRDLNYANRAIAQAYARAAAYFARDYITEEQYEIIDDRTNDQNNKSFIKIDLEVLRNDMEEQSELDVVGMFNDKYNVVSNYVDCKVDLSSGDEKDLVNILNLKYLSSEKVSTKDKNTILGEYDEDSVKETLVNIDAITKYNYKNQDDMIAFSNLLISEASDTDKMSLNYVQFNSIKLLETVDSQDATFDTIYSNPYFQNLYKYFTKQDFVYKYQNNSGNIVEENITWQSISDGVNFVNNEVILYTLNQYSKANNMDSFIELTNENLSQSIQYVQNTIMGECEKVDAKEYVKS